MKMIKYTVSRLLLAIVLLNLFGCSHAYVRQWGGNKITTCCRSGQLFCSQKTMQAKAEKQCNSAVYPLSYGSVTSGAQSYYDNNSIQTSFIQDSCITYSCM